MSTSPQFSFEESRSAESLDALKVRMQTAIAEGRAPSEEDLLLSQAWGAVLQAKKTVDEFSSPPLRLALMTEFLMVIELANPALVKPLGSGPSPMGQVIKTLASDLRDL